MGSLRLHEASVTVPNWQGTLGDVSLLAKHAMTSLATRHAAAELSFELGVQFINGSQFFDTLAVFDDARDDIEPDTISHVWLSVRAPRRSEDVYVAFDGRGASVRAESADRVWVEGVVAVLGQELERNRQLSKRRGLRHLTRAAWPRIATVAAAIVAMAALVVVLGLIGRYNLGAWIVNGVLVLVGAIGIALVADPLAVDAPGFSVVTEQEAVSEAPRPGLSHRVRDWIAGRPLVGLLLGIVLGVAINKLSDLL